MLEANSTILYRKSSNCNIFYGDCREILKSFSEQVDLIITSPPYADARRNHYDSISPDKYKEWFLTFHETFYSVLKPNGSFILNIKDKVVDGVRHRYVWDTLLALSELGWYSIDDYIWHKTNPMPGFWPTRLSDGWEYCFHLSKSKKPYFDRYAVMKPIGNWVNTRLKKLNDNDKSRHNSANDSGFGRDISKWVGKDKVSPSNVLSLALVGKNKGHPAVFPVDLPMFFIKLLCPANGLVLDPFAGSGTTGVAALLLERNSILIDNNENYYQEAIARIAKEASALPEKEYILPGME
jgi:site-specific DNA-methyltransferase (adenine-specific)